MKRALRYAAPAGNRFTPLALVCSILCAAGCSSALSPEDPTDIGAWMRLYDVPGVSVAVFNDFELDYLEIHGVTNRSTREPVT